MPFRSPKMNSFIFGFQRFVWWPKCTPASSRSFIAIAAKCPPLPFAELEAFPRSRHAVLLTFFRAGVSRQQPLSLERLAQLAVVLDQRARDAETDGAGLARNAAAGDRRQNIEFVRRFGEDQRGSNLGAESFGGEERFERSAVDADGPGAGPEKNAGRRCLATAGAVILDCCHV